LLEEGAREYLKGFKMANVHFHLMADEELKDLSKKKKFIGLFDGGALSVNSAACISEDFGMLFKDKSQVHVETGDFLIGLKPD
jgi:hypothetical protein